MIALLPLVLALLLGCGASRRGVVHDPPRWQSEEGKTDSRIALADALARGGSADQSLTLIAQLRTEGIHSPELGLVQARALRQAGLVDDAESVLRELVRKHPRLAGAHDQLGVLLLDTRQVEAALASLQRAAQLDPDDAQILNNLGFAQLTAGQHAEAVATLRQALQLDGADRQIRNNLGFALVADNRADEALRVFRAGMPEPDARYNLALGLEMGGKSKAAFEEYAAVLSTWPGHQPSIEGIRRLDDHLSTPEPSPTDPATEAP